MCMVSCCRNHSYTDGIPSHTPWHVGPQPGFFEGNEPIETPVRLSDEWHESIEKSELDVIALSLAMAMLVVVATVFCVFCREERDGTVSDAANICRSPPLCRVVFLTNSCHQDICSIWSEHRRINRQKIILDDFFRNESLELTTTTTLS